MHMLKEELLPLPRLKISSRATARAKMAEERRPASIGQIQIFFPLQTSVHS